MTSIDYDETPYEPPTKIAKLTVNQYPSLYVKLALTTLFDTQKAQSIFLSETPIKNEVTKPQFRQMAFNLSFIAIEEDEFVAINKSIREILDWKTQRIPYLQLFVKDSSTRRLVLNRSSMLLASFAQLPPCCIGIRIELNKKEDEYLHNHQVTELRRILWTFLLNELPKIQSHVKIFLSTELKHMANQDISSSPKPIPTTYSNSHQIPAKPQVKTLIQMHFFCMLNMKIETKLLKLSIMQVIIIIEIVSFHLQIDTTLSKKLESSHHWKKYVQKLQKWNKTKNLEKDNQIRLKSLFSISRQFKQFSSSTKLIDDQNAHWQIDTIEIHLQRGNTLKEICEAIRLNTTERCRKCPDQNHSRGECLIDRQKARKKRVKLSRNNRKDNQADYYANRAPFQLLTGNLIPQRVFEIYDCEFVPFYSR